MKITNASVLVILSVLGLVGLVTSCSDREDLSGTWQGNPARVVIANADEATSTVTLSFAPASEGNKGQVTLSAVVDLQQAVNTTIDATFDQPYTASVAATASIGGTYVYDSGDDDDLLLTFDPSSFAVNVDPAGVMFSENIVSGSEQPLLDSLSAATAERWRLAISTAMREEFAKYQKIDDVKIHHTDIMSAEVADRDMSFRKIAQN